MRRIFTVLALLIFCTSFSAFAAEDQKPAREIAGTYNAKGVGVDGKSYEVTVSIEKKGDTFLIKWNFADADVKGVGIRDGDILSVGWTSAGKPAVVVYKITGDKLEGRWADGSADGKVFTETLTRVP